MDMPALPQGPAFGLACLPFRSGILVTGGSPAFGVRGSLILFLATLSVKSSDFYIL
jgi:hypothetical protein